MRKKIKQPEKADEGPTKKRKPRVVSNVLGSLELFRCFPEADIVKLLDLKQCSASKLVHNRKPKKVKS